MNPILRNILAVVAGLILGSVVNMSIIMMSSHLIPPPEGVDVTTVEGLKAGIHLFQPKHFLMPFLAHALGTFVGAILTSFVAINHKMNMAILIGVIFFIGGFANVIMLPAPMWFNVLDLVGAYFPFAFIGGKIGLMKK